MAQDDRQDPLRDAGREAAADDRYWRGNGRTVAVLTIVWLFVSVAPALWAAQAEIQVWGLSLPVWIAAQAAPVAYVLIAWFYERRMDRLDRAHRAQCIDADA